MCAEQTNALELKQQTLRAELKTWEHTFAETNGGRKAGKDDIKKVPDIAAKYKEYNKLRQKLSATSNSSEHSSPKSRKRKSEATEYPTTQHPSILDPYDIPQPLLATPRAARSWIGPTPQKNGQVLGLFDTLSPNVARVATPSRLKGIPPEITVLPQLMQTPSRRGNGIVMLPSENIGSTPSSSSKRRRIDPAKTPSNQRQQVLAEITPLSNRLNRPAQPAFDRTPAFLKRYSEPSEFQGSENQLGKDIAYSPPRIRLPRKPAGRSLSQLVQSLRQQEDEKLDEELALMYEIETGQAPPPKLLVQNSQLVDLPLGADGEHDLSDDDVVENQDAPKRLWKKRGQKRTTRKANIGVNRAKWKPEAEWTAGRKDNENQDPGSEAVGDDTTKGSDTQQSSQPSKSKTAVGETKPAEQGKKEKKLRKINPNATSHANFRSLKIRNKNSKGRKGGRFGRR